MLRILFLILFINLLSLGTALPQDIKTTYAYAQQEYAIGNFENSILAFERILFFDQANAYPQVFQHLASSYFQVGNYDVAARYYDLSYFNNQSDSIRNEMIFGKVNCLLIQQKFKLAMMDLLNINPLESYYFQNKLDFYLGVTYFWLEDYKASETHFQATLNSENHHNRSELEKAFKVNQKVSTINPKMAKIMSVFLPGLGQVFYGNVKQGVNSFLLTGGILALYYNFALAYSLWEGMLVVVPWFDRYYKGGFQKAETLALKKKENKRNEVFRKLLDIVAADKTKRNYTQTSLKY